MEFIISIEVGFDKVLTGGVLALHKLSYELAYRGQKVIIFTEPEYPHPNIRIEKGSSENNLNFEYDPDRTIICPSFDWKNNSDIKNVARWALYHVNQEMAINVCESDEIFNFGTFYVPTKKIVRKLTVLDYKKEIYFNRGKKRNKKYCHILLKNNPEGAENIIGHFNSFSLDDYKTKGCFDYLAEKFNEFEYFLTFDDKTFLTTAAALCGCKPIILKKNNISPWEYRKNNPIQAVGVAYGIDDLEWVESTLKFVSNHIDYLIEQDNKTIDEFIEFWKTKINQ